MSRRTLNRRHYVKGPLSKQAKAGIGNFTSGASAKYKKGPGSPPKKKRRKAWWAGAPLRMHPTVGVGEVSSKFSSKLG